MRIWRADTKVVSAYISLLVNQPAASRRDRFSRVSMLLFQDTAIVTGAGGAIGRAIAQAMASEGAKIVVTDIDAALGQSTMREIIAGGGIAEFIEADLAEERSAEAVLNFALNKFGRISLFVHCASPNHFGATLARSSEQDWSQMFGVNLFAAFRMGRLIGQHMTDNHVRGRMLLITSLHAESIRRVPHYSAAKSGLTMFMRELAVELGPRGIRVNALAPGMIAPDMLPEHEPFAEAAALRRIGAPAECANMAVAILSERFGSFVTGSVITVDGGLSLFNWMTHPA
jgi:3-oxoacyl-[acyl-carrier protein] reductase